MPVVNIEEFERLLGASGPVALGEVVARYMAGDEPYVKVDGPRVTVAPDIRVAIVNGALAEPLDLEATGADCFVELTITSFNGPFSVARDVAIPAGDVDYEDLVDVDRYSFTPVNPTPTLLQTIDERILGVSGDLSDLETTATTTLVAAINEVHAATARITDMTRLPRGPRFAAIGDSIIAAGLGLSEREFGRSIQSNVSWLSDGRLHLVRNAGLSGDTVADVIERFNADLTPFTPDVVLIRVGVNDTNTAMTTEQYLAGIETIVGMAYELGAVPILDTITPVDDAGSPQNTKIVDWNRALLAWARENGVRCANSWALAVASNGLTWPDTSYTSDGIHPNEKGQRVIGRAIRAAIQDLPQWPFRSDELAAGTLVSNPLFTTDAGADGIADGWAVTGGSDATSPAFSLVNVDGVAGKMQRVTLPAQTGAKTTRLEQGINVSNPGTFSTGDRVRVSALVEVVLANSDAGNSVVGRLGFFAWNGSGYDVFAYVLPGDGRVRVSFEYAVRAPDDNQWILFLDTATGIASGSTGGEGYVQFGEMDIVNLTRRGLIHA